MRLHDVHQGVVKFKKRKRIGRGPGSGQGKTAGRGHKGQSSRAGWSQPAVFQGGAMPLVRRVPKRGFNNPFAVKVAVLNVADLERTFPNGAEVNRETIKQTPLLGRRFDQLKILGDGELTKKFTVSAHRFSATAIEKIEKAGGKVIVIPGPTPVEEKKKQQREG